MAPSPEQVKAVINTTLRFRFLLITSWFWSVLCLLLANLVFFLGDTASQGHRGVAMIVFDTASLGLSYYQAEHSKTELHRNIKELIPDDATNPLSITRYLGAYDWYSISYSWTCKGYFKLRKGRDGRQALSQDMAEATCNSTLFSANKPFSLRSQIQKDLKPSVQGLVNSVPDKTYDIRPITWIWFAAIICTLLIFFFLPWMFRRHKLLGTKNWCLVPSFIAMLSQTKIMSNSSQVAFSVYLVAWCMIEHLANNTTADIIMTSVAAPFRTMTILCIIFMLFCCLIGFAGYAGGVLLEHNKPKKDASDLEGDDESEDSPDASRPLNVMEPVPMDDVHQGGDGTSSAHEEIFIPAVELPQMQILSPRPILEEDNLFIIDCPVTEFNMKEQRTLEDQIKHISEYIVNSLIQQTARARTFAADVRCQACGSASTQPRKCTAEIGGKERATTAI